MKLKNFDEHWREKYKASIIKDVTNKASGIACPKCGFEIMADYTMDLLSSPSQNKAWCVTCEWTGYI